METIGRVLGYSTALEVTATGGTASRHDFSSQGHARLLRCSFAPERMGAGEEKNLVDPKTNSAPKPPRLIHPRSLLRPANPEKKLEPPNPKPYNII